MIKIVIIDFDKIGIFSFGLTAAHSKIRIIKQTTKQYIWWVCLEIYLPNKFNQNRSTRLDCSWAVQTTDRYFQKSLFWGLSGLYNRYFREKFNIFD